jgi:hypothetical protein
MSNDPYSDCLELFNEEKDKKSCKARLDLYYHLFYNKFLQNFIIDEMGKIIPGSEGVYIDDWDSEIFKKNRKNCIKIPTNTTHSMNRPQRSLYNNNNTAVIFDIVQQYTIKESEDIYRAIQNPNCSDEYCSDASGDNIIFDAHGNLKLNVPIIQSDDFETKTFYNKKIRNRAIQFSIDFKKIESDSLYARFDSYKFIDDNNNDN